MRNRGAVRQVQNRMDDVAAHETGVHDASRFRRTFEKFVLAGSAPHGEQAAKDDPGIEEVCEGLRRIAFRGRVFERKLRRGAVPCITRQETRRFEARVQIVPAGCFCFQVDQGANGVSRNFSRYASVCAGIRMVIASDASFRFLYARIQKPRARQTKRVRNLRQNVFRQGIKLLILTSVVLNTMPKRLY